GRNRVWTIRAGAGETVTLTLDGVTVTRGLASTGEAPHGGGVGAVAFDGGTVTLALRHTRLSANRALGAGGGLSVRAVNGGRLHATVERSVVTGNRALAGGAIDAGTRDGELLLT